MKLKEVDSYNSLELSTLDSDLTDDSTSSFSDTSSFSFPEWNTTWPFGFFWPEVARQFPTKESLYAAFEELHFEIQAMKERFRDLALPFPDLQIESNLSGGVSASYFLIDQEGNRRFVIKPLDEDAGCINSELFPTPFRESPFRDNMPLYRSSLREVLGFLVAEAIGVSEIVPKTVLGIFESDQFHDFSEGVSLDELPQYMELCGPVDQEKLCSVQEYVPHAEKSLFEALQDLQWSGLSDEEIANRIDQKNFEDANILLWTTYETDGHMGNFLVYPKGVDEVGNEILGLKKIDNGLAFPDKNEQLRNNLIFLPNAKRELSEEAKAKIAAIDVEVLAKQFEKMGLESAIPALKQRIPALQALAKQPGITIKEINTAMSRIGKKL